MCITLLNSPSILSTKVDYVIDIFSITKLTLLYTITLSLSPMTLTILLSLTSSNLYAIVGKINYEK